MASSAKSTFVYPKRLSGRKIRLIRIQPGQGSDQLSVSLEEVDLDDHPDFVAISYVWGDPNDTRSATCDGCQIEITRNLYAVLWQLREEAKRESFWADAICINQRDVVEKTTQVRMMSDIYGKAGIVFIWLREQLPDDLLGITLMEHIVKFVDEHPPPYAPPLSTAEFGFDGVPLEAWRAMLAIFLRPWFSRAWVVQEYVQATSFMFRCGALLVPPNALLGSVRRISKFRSLRLLATRAAIRETNDGVVISPFFSFAHVRPREHLLQWLFAEASALKATDDRDKLFALVGISSDGDRGLISYDREFRDLVSDLAMEQMRKGIAAGVTDYVYYYLCRVHKGESKVGRASWAPAFDNPANFHGLGSIFSSAYRSNTMPHILFTPQKHLQLRGKVIDTVHTKIDDETTNTPVVQFSGVRDDLKMAEYYRQILSFHKKILGLVHLRALYPAGEDLQEILWRSMIFDTEAMFVQASKDMEHCFKFLEDSFALSVVWLEHQEDMHINASPKDMLQILQQLLPTMMWRPTVSPPGPDFWTQIRQQLEECAIPSVRFANAISLFQWDRTYFASELGYVGWVPCHAEVGDLICAFIGSRFPFVVRPCGDGYRLIGACYMHGIMEGQACELPALDGSEDSMITLI